MPEEEKHHEGDHKASGSHEEWLAKLRRDSEAEIDTEADEPEEPTTEEAIGKKSSRKDLFMAGGIFFLALAVRLYFLYFVSGTQNAGMAWYGDVYHHWQIAYLTKTVGLSHGFLRLWDLKGMEYYWGLMHPLVLVILFTITGSVNILVPRLLSVFCGSLVAAFVYLLVRRHFNRWAAVMAGIWAALFPVVLFSDTLGMQEQLGLVFLLGGVLAWPRWVIASGLCWAAASMVRSEYWLFSFALTLAAAFDTRKGLANKKPLMLAAYFIPILAYMKYMLNYTGNPIYPIWWNYLASVVGKWFTNVSTPLDPGQIQAQWIGRGIFLIGVLGFIPTILKRPKSYLFLLVGFSNIAFIGFIFGFAAYVHGFFDRFWVDRLFAFPYLFAGALLSVFLFYVLPQRLKKIRLLLIPTGLIIFMAALLISQIFWFKIMTYFRLAQAPFENEILVANMVARDDPGGKILFPADRPVLTYALAVYHNYDGNRFISNMYDPYFYAKEGESKADLQDAVFKWFEKEDIRYLILGGREEYRELINDHPDKFRRIEDNYGVTLYEFLR